jgi:hypothetical protein
MTWRAIVVSSRTSVSTEGLDNNARHVIDMLFEPSFLEIMVSLTWRAISARPSVAAAKSSEIKPEVRPGRYYPSHHRHAKRILE